MAAVRQEELVERSYGFSENPGLDMARQALGSLVMKGELAGLYMAAWPGYLSNFSRDGLISPMLRGDAEALSRQAEYSLANQAQKSDPASGASEGKSHHEKPAIVVNDRGYNTEYNSCDTTALTLTSVAIMGELGDLSLLNNYELRIQKAIGYIFRHVEDDGLFYEDPRHAGATEFGLKVTNWKDSVLNHKTRQEPAYPVVYSLVHFQNALALGRIGKLMGRPDLIAASDEMIKAGIEKLWRDDHFVNAIDAYGEIDPPNSDSLQALLHIPLSSIPVGMAMNIERYMEKLATAAGYRTGRPVKDGLDPYHTRYIWTHEQALLHSAATKHGLEEASSIAQRVMDYIPAEKGIFPELIDPLDNFKPAGNDLQLWAICAYLYFHNPEQALL